MDRKLHWMARMQPGGTRFGVPWAKGALSPDTKLYLYGEDGAPVAMQQEIQAWWPDGSVKWTLHSAVLEHPQAGYRVSDEAPETPAQAVPPLKVRKGDGQITVDTGKAVWQLTAGTHQPIQISAPGVGTIDGRLEMLLERRLETGGYDTLTQVSPFDGVAETVTLEREGPLSAVVCLHGNHQTRGAVGRTRTWLPFDLRLYFYAGQAAVRMVHTFLFDGREEEDFIRGIGLSFTLPLTGALHNRFVRLGGESGLFCESPKSLWTRNDPEGVYRKQLEGVVTPETQSSLQNDMTVWRDYRLTQLCSDHYDIAKRTDERCVWVRGAAGKRSLGVAYAGGENGGLAAFKRDFWQKSPASIEVSGMSTPNGTLTLWLYSPDGPAMDMRRYDDRTHVKSCYEGFDEMRASGYGIGNTNELVVEPLAAYPGNEALVERAKAWQTPALLLCDPGEVRDTLALGDAWAPRDLSTPGRSRVEGYLDDLLEQMAVVREEHDQYGFWDYGDIRHTYDAFRHNWLYDMGGYAWQNTELVPNLYLWYGFLRTGRPDYFAWAEAMTRHCSECDLYHIGPYRMLGSRHNVVHWGCGCKECRIGLTQLYKVYYYLTGDERIGAIMTAEKDVDFAVANLDPLRAYYPPDPNYPCHVRFGPDLMVFVGNWATHYERTRDPQYREKIERMLAHFTEPGSFSSGMVWGYDPFSGRMALLEQTPPSHFNYCFGAVYVWTEVLAAFGAPAHWRALLNSGLIYSPNGDPDGVASQWDAPPEHVNAQGWNAPRGGDVSPKGKISGINSGMAAYAAGKAQDKALAALCWDQLDSRDQRRAMPMPLYRRRVDEAGVHKPLMEYVRLAGNDIGQWGSNTIAALAWIPDALDDRPQQPEPEKKP